MRRLGAAEPPLNGLFEVEPGRRVSGSLLLNGRNTALHLWGDENLIYPASGTIRGEVEGKKVSIVSWTIKSHGTSVSEGTASEYCHIVPHVVLLGYRDVTGDEAAVSRISFVMDDGGASLYEWGVFGSVFGRSDLVRTVLEGYDPDRDVEVGERARLSYYTGKETVFSSRTVLGVVGARHHLGFSLAGPSGVGMDNTIVTEIDFSPSIRVCEAIERMHRVAGFFGIVLGRVQNLDALAVHVDGSEKDDLLALYDTWIPRYERSAEFRVPSARDVLIHAARDSFQFEQVLACWLERDAERRSARDAFQRCWAEGGSYGPDRTVRAANMFDLLPKDTFAGEGEVPENLSSAVTEARRRFRQLPRSGDRDSVLGALGRVGRMSLKRRIRARAGVLGERMGERLPNLAFVTDAAVDLRNQYVHGSQSGKVVDEASILTVFLTDTLEFVFAGSELLEAGWGLEGWLARGDTTGHPFGQYLYSYQRNLDALRRELES